MTHEYKKHIKNSRLEIIVSNEIAGNDPDKGFLKELYIKYVYDGKTFERRIKEASKIQLFSIISVIDCSSVIGCFCVKKRASIGLTHASSLFQGLRSTTSYPCLVYHVQYKSSYS